MSRPTATDALPPSARAIALLVASTPGIYDAQPAVLHQLLEFGYRYAGQVLQDAQVYSEHAGRNGRVEMLDVTLAVQARVGWELGGRVPKDYINSLAAQTNNTPLPPVPEVFGVRLPPASECLTAVDFDLIPNRPPPEVKLYDEEVEEIEESSEEEDDYAESALPGHMRAGTAQSEDAIMGDSSSAPPLSAYQSPVPELPGPPIRPAVVVDDEEDEEEDDLFAGGDDDADSDAAMEEVQEGGESGPQRKLVEDDDYD